MYYELIQIFMAMHVTSVGKHPQLVHVIMCVIMVTNELPNYNW